jgi:hypothetical protein
MTVPVGGGSVSTKKQNPSDGKRHVSMMETGTETPSLPVTETITTSPVTETITTSRSRVPSSLATNTAAVSAIRSALSVHSSGAYFCLPEKTVFPAGWKPWIAATHSPLTLDREASPIAHLQA